MRHIRRATTDDAEKISTLISFLAREHIGPTLSNDGLKKLLYGMDVQSIRRKLDNGWPTYCALESDTLVGVVIVRPPSHLYHLFVQAHVHGQGVGRALFEVADDGALELFGSRLKTVNSALNVIAIYRRFGFEPEGTILEIDGIRFQPMTRTTMEKRESR